MIDIVTPRKGKTHVRTSMNAPYASDTLCGRKVVGYQGTTEAFVGSDTCKSCAKGLPAPEVVERTVRPVTHFEMQSWFGNVNKHKRNKRRR